MMELKYESYATGQIVCFNYERTDEDPKKLDKFDVLKKLGFSRIDLLEPYFYKNKGSVFLELAYFKGESGYIVEMWNDYEILFAFYCPHLREASHAVKHLLQIAKSMVYIEQSLGVLNKKDDDDARI